MQSRQFLVAYAKCGCCLVSPMCTGGYRQDGCGGWLGRRQAVRTWSMAGRTRSRAASRGGPDLSRVAERVSWWRTDAVTASVMAVSSRTRPAADRPTRPLPRMPVCRAMAVARSGGHPGKSRVISGARRGWKFSSAPAIIPHIVGHELADGAKEFTLAPEGFHDTFCADIPADDAAFYAISQRPLAGVALTEAAGTPAWRSRPVWGVLGTADRCIDPGVHRFSYERM